MSQEEELTVDNIPVMRGLFDVVCVIWTGFKKELNMVGSTLYLCIHVGGYTTHPHHMPYSYICYVVYTYMYVHIYFCFGGRGALSIW